MAKQNFSNEAQLNRKIQKQQDELKRLRALKLRNELVEKFSPAEKDVLAMALEMAHGKMQSRQMKDLIASLYFKLTGIALSQEFDLDELLNEELPQEGLGEKDMNDFIEKVMKQLQGYQNRQFNEFQNSYHWNLHGDGSQWSNDAWNNTNNTTSQALNNFKIDYLDGA